MGIQEIKGKEGIQEYFHRRQTGQQEGFQESLIQNLESRKQKVKSVEETELKTRKSEEASGVGMLGSLSGRRVNAMAQREAVQAAEVRHMSYEESDNIEIAVVEGYTLKGKLEGQQVYVEAKYEDGRTEAYHVDTAKVQEQTQHKIEQFALETAAPSQKNGMTGTAAVKILR